MTEAFEKWVEKVHTHQYPIGTEKAIGFNLLTAFAKEVVGRSNDEMNEQVGLLTCAEEKIDKEFLLGFCTGVAFEKAVRDFGLDGDALVLTSCMIQ